MYKYEPHKPVGVVAGKTYCVKCGLVYLNNDFTRWGIKAGCNQEDHPQYSAMRMKFTRLNNGR